MSEPTEVMTPDEFRERMQSIIDGQKHDLEGAHWDADQLMCNLLIDLGYQDGVHLFQEMEKWYA